MQDTNYESICNMLMGYESRGIRITIQGMCYPVYKIAEILSFNDNDCYMPDFIMDIYGKLVEINYDKIVQM